MDERVKPRLLALLICEKVLFDDQRVGSLIGLVDTFNVVLAAPGAIEEPAKLVTNIECVVFTKWGLGKGEFTDELRVIQPDGTEGQPTSKMKIILPGGFAFHNIRRAVTLFVRSGDYAFRVYLDDDLVAEHPFRVNIDRKRFSVGGT